VFSWLPNRIGFDGPNPKGKDLPSNQNPIQHFSWWDARIDSEDRGSTFTYEVFPVVGPWDNLKLLTKKSRTIDCRIPKVEEQKIGTYFNRAVVSSQAFINEFGAAPTGAKYHQALSWLTNGMNEAIVSFIKESEEFDGVIYHLADTEWVLPALQETNAKVSFVYYYKPTSASGKSPGDATNLKAIQLLKKKKNITFYPRTKTSIMHDKFLIRKKNNIPIAVLMGTANFTTEGLTSQANVIHTFDSPSLAVLYQRRHDLLAGDPAVAATAKEAAWSDKIKIGDVRVRVFFPPEPGKSRSSIDVVVDAVKDAKSSVIFSLFSATDQPLLDACFSAADEGKLMYGLVNTINEPKSTDKETAATIAAIRLYNRSKDDFDVVGHADFNKGDEPAGFWWETSKLSVPGAKTSGTFAPEVFVHNKFIVIDGETSLPTIFVGSANMSGNSVWHNDENLIEITKCPRISEIYIAEFMRLYEHYRARLAWNRRQKDTTASKKTFALSKNTGWAAKDYKPGTPEYKSRTILIQPLPKR
ncbi:MAG: phospholipase, partial [Cytophagales bacterium]|nr:phospholipase [Cytophaga sp.]